MHSLSFLPLLQIDYFERAKRQEEIPLLETQAEEDAKRLRDQWVKQEEERVRYN